VKSTRRLTLALAVVVNASVAGAQHDMHSMPGMQLTLPLGLPLGRMGSATSWLPDSSPMAGHHFSVSDWSLMLHGVVSGQYDHQNGFRGAAEFGMIDWEMLMAARAVGGGLLRFNAMTSFEALTLPRQGYPELLQTGGTDRGARIVNRQHPHNLVNEAAAAYDHSLTSRLAASLYVAAIGEPALGPVAYMHRPSAGADPFAPLGHHWQDASHESFGVITAGVYSRAVKLEGSIFNAREGDSYYYNLDYAGARLDSYSGRISVEPSPNVVIAAWGGYLMAHDRLETPIGMQRYGASVLTTGTLSGRRWSGAAIWGLNIHHHGSREHVHDPNATNLKFYHLSSSELLEGTLDLTAKTQFTARVEQVQKTGDELGFTAGDLTQLFTVRSASVAATREVVRFGEFNAAVGARASVQLLPETLRLTYQTRTPTGFAIYVQLR
jgi:hypothetical protein